MEQQFRKELSVSNNIVWVSQTKKSESCVDGSSPCTCLINISPILSRINTQKKVCGMFVRSVDFRFVLSE